LARDRADAGLGAGGAGSVWLTDYDRGDTVRIAIGEALNE
jgi:hypothetical protein